MKRFLSMMLVAIVTFSITTTALAADILEPSAENITNAERVLLTDSDSFEMDPNSVETGNVPQYDAYPMADNLSYAPSSHSDDIESLSDRSCVQATDISGFVTLGDDTAICEEIDLSSAIDLSDEFLKDNVSAASLENSIASVADLPENQPPVADPAFILVNPESLRDEKYTTDTEFLLITRYNNQDLCYDPEGGPISILFNDSFPSGYIKHVQDSAGTMEGYRIHIFNTGMYPFVFTFIDAYGEASQIFSLNFEITKRGVFTEISDSLASTSDVKEYAVTVDYSVSDQYCFSVLRKGNGGFHIEIYNPDGSKLTSTRMTATAEYQWYQNFIKYDILQKPDGVSGNYTYTVRIYATEDEYVQDDTSYQIAYGHPSQMMYFFEDVKNAVDLPYYHSIRNNDQNEPAYSSPLPASDFGNYYKITTIGDEVVTLASKNGQYRFKILDVNSMETLYDSKDESTFILEDDILKTHMLRAKLNFASGTSYYVVVYDSNATNAGGTYTLTVGEPRLLSSSKDYSIPSTRVSKGTPYTWEFTFQTLTGRPGYIKEVDYSSSGAGWPYEGGHFSVLTPGTSEWRTNSPMYYPIKYDFTNLNAPLVRCDGDWKFRFTAAESGAFPGSTLHIYYAYEV